MFYDPRNDSLEELRGSGMAMGIDGDHDYGQYAKEDLADGQIILMGTDGIWEAQNLQGEMFGKDPLYRIIRQYSDMDAKGLLPPSSRQFAPEIGESVICVEDEDTIGSKPLNDFSLRMRNAFEAAKPLEMRAARVIEYRDIGAHQIGEIGDFTSMISAHFDNREGLFTETTKG